MCMLSVKMETIVGTLSIIDKPVDLDTRGFARATTAPEALGAMNPGAKSLMTMSRTMMFDGKLGKVVNKKTREVNTWVKMENRRVVCKCFRIGVDANNVIWQSSSMYYNE